jgi:four helix bundle protein
VNKKVQNFTDLLVWQKAHKLTISTYKITESFPKSEIYALTNQMRRAGISIGSNIAEGFGRRNPKEKIHFYNIAQGSLTELKNQLLISKDIYFLSKKDFLENMNKADEVHKLLNSLIKRIKNYSPKF